MSVPSIVPVPESEGSTGRPVIAASALQKSSFRANGPSTMVGPDAPTSISDSAVISAR